MHTRIVSVSTLLLIGAISASAMVALWWRSSASLASDDKPYPCVVVANMQALPTELELGSTVTVTLGFRLSCPDETRAIHKVVVVDQTVDDRRPSAAKTIAHGAVYWMNMDTHPASKGGGCTCDADAGCWHHALEYR